MNLVYVANARMPTERAHGLQIAKMCEAFADAGAQVTLLLPRRRNDQREDVFSAYGVKKNFTIRYLPTLELSFHIPGAFELQTFVFGLSAWYWLKRNPRPDAVYTRGEMVLLLTRFLPREMPVYWEAHIKPNHPQRYRRATQAAAGIVVITKYFAEEIRALWDIPQERIFYAADGVSLESFEHLPAREEARRALNLPLEKKLAVYTGSDLPWKGLRYLRAASALLPQGYLVAFVGAIEPGAATSHQVFPGTRPYAEMPTWLAAADALVLTGDANSAIAMHYTSPMKLFEYMAAGKPIVASDLPSFREVLDDRSAYFAAPDNAQALADAIVEAVEHPGKARQSKALAEKYSWGNRAKSVLDFFD